MRKVKIEIKGNAPMLIHKYIEEQVKAGPGKKDYGTPREQAEARVYVDSKRKLYIPWTWISGAIRTISSDFKSNVSKRKSLKTLVGGAILFQEDKLFFKENHKLKDIKVHECTVVIKGCGRIMRSRAQIDNWSFEFTVLLRDELVTVSELEALIIDAGSRAGIGDFRISKGGPYGTFDVVSFEVIEETEKAA